MVRFAAPLACALLLGPLLFYAGAARAKSPMATVGNFGPDAVNDVAARLLAAEVGPISASLSW